MGYSVTGPTTIPLLVSITPDILSTHLGHYPTHPITLIILLSNKIVATFLLKCNFLTWQILFIQDKSKCGRIENPSSEPSQASAKGAIHILCKPPRGGGSHPICFLLSNNWGSTGVHLLRCKSKARTTHPIHL